MPKTKIAITMRKDLLEDIDDLVRKGNFPNRSQAVESAVRDKIDRLRKSRLARECRKLDAAREKGIAEEGFEQDAAEWPEY